MTTDWMIDIIDTVDGPREQIVLGHMLAESEYLAWKSARQAQAARDQQGRGMMRHKVAQREPGPLFAPVSHEPELPL